MTKNSARKAFSDAQRFQTVHLVQLANRILESQGACHGVVKSGSTNPVIELSFQNRASLRIELRERDYLAVVKSATTLPREAVEKAAFNTNRNKDGACKGSYESDAHRFSFESDDLQSLSSFVAAFAKAQRPDAVTAVTARAEKTHVQPSPAPTRSEILAHAEHDYNILQQQKRVTSGELVQIAGTDAHMTPQALKAFKAALLAQGLVMRQPGNPKTAIAQVYLPEIVVGNKTITDNSTHFVDVIPARVRRESRVEAAQADQPLIASFEIEDSVEPAAEQTRTLQPAELNF